MGIPVIDAPGEAEAQCAELVRMGKAYASATEDMDGKNCHLFFFLPHPCLPPIGNLQLLLMGLAARGRGYPKIQSQVKLSRPSAMGVLHALYMSLTLFF